MGPLNPSMNDARPSESPSLMLLSEGRPKHASNSRRIVASMDDAPRGPKRSRRQLETSRILLGTSDQAILFLRASSIRTAFFALAPNVSSPFSTQRRIWPSTSACRPTRSLNLAIPLFSSSCSRFTSSSMSAREIASRLFPTRFPFSVRANRAKDLMRPSLSSRLDSLERSPVLRKSLSESDHVECGTPVNSRNSFV